MKQDPTPRLPQTYSPAPISRRKLAACLVSLGASWGGQVRGRLPAAAATQEGRPLPGQFDQPTGMVTDDFGNLFVADFNNHRIQVFDRSGQFLSTWGEYGSAPGAFKYPAGLALTSSNAILVADHGNHRLQKFTRDGKFLSEVGPHNAVPAPISLPFWVASAPNGRIYLSSSQSETVQVLASNGGELGVWGTSRAGSAPGEFSRPSGIAVTDTSDVLVADFQNARMQRFTTSGGFLGAWGEPGAGPGEFAGPLGVAIGPTGDIFVTDSENARVQVFDENGSFLRAWGSSGEVPGRFLLPGGITVDAAGDVYVADLEGDVVQKFTADGVYLLTIGEDAGDGGTAGSETQATRTPAAVSPTPDDAVASSDPVEVLVWRSFQGRAEAISLSMYVMRVDVPGTADPTASPTDVMHAMLQQLYATVDEADGADLSVVSAGALESYATSTLALDGIVTMAVDPDVFYQENPELSDVVVEPPEEGITPASFLGWTNGPLVYFSFLFPGLTLGYDDLLAVGLKITDRVPSDMAPHVASDGLRAGGLWDLLPRAGDVPGDLIFSSEGGTTCRRDGSDCVSF